MISKILFRVEYTALVGMYLFLLQIFGDTPSDPPAKEEVVTVSHGRLKSVRFVFELPEPTTPQIELENRLVRAKTYWGAGRGGGSFYVECRGVGCLDASIPPPDVVPRPPRTGNRFSKYGSLQTLVQQLDTDGSFNKDGKRIYSDEEWVKLRQLSKGHTSAYLSLLETEVEVLFAMLDRAVELWKKQRN